MTWDNRLKRNVLEISLEKESDAFEELGCEAIARLFRTLGVNIERDVEGYLKKNKSIHLWLINGIDLDRFCKNESIRVSKTTKTGFIRPAGKKEVTVNISGLDFNTPDTFVMEYLSKFGNVITTSVIYDKYKEGVFAGKYNGDRKYQVDFTKSSLSMGKFHLIDGSRVRVHYPGNKKTCGRCHQTAEHCKGEAVARSWEDNDGVRVDIKDHMKALWEAIDFQPHAFQFNLGDAESESTNDAPIKDAAKFSPNVARPTPTEEEMKRYNGKSIKNFPKETKKVDIVNLLHAKGLPEDFSENNIQFGNHGNVEVKQVPAQLCQEIINNIHFAETLEKFFGKPIYCRATRDLTPEKQAKDIPETEETNVVNDAKVQSIVITKQDEAAALPNATDGFVFGEYDPISKIRSKLLNDTEESSEDSDTNDDHGLAKEFLKTPKTTGNTSTTKPKKRTRATPTGTSGQKIEKKTKTQT